MKDNTLPAKPSEYERTLKAEQLRVSEAQALLNAGAFVSLAEAARQAHVPLSTLAHAVRNGKLPGLQVQPRRWLVRLAAVKLWQQDGDDKPAERRVLEAMVAEGLLETEDLVYPRPRLSKIKPAKISGKPLSQTIIEDRR